MKEIKCVAPDHKELMELLARLEERVTANEKFVMLNLSAQKESVAAAMAASEKAINKADSAIEKRLESVNEFRSQLKDQASTFITRNEVEQIVRGLEKMNEGSAEKIALIFGRIDRAEGTGKGLNAGWMFLVGGIGIIASISSVIAIFFTFFRH